MANENHSKVTTATADKLSLKIYHLTEIVKLAAFAAEARRTLEGIDGALTYHRDMQQVIIDNVSHSNNWIEMQDASAEVLRYVSRELVEVGREVATSIYTALDQKSSTKGVAHA